MRDIQVAFGQRGGGGGGGGGGNGATRDLQGLFDLELDTEKNQYEGARQTQTADQRQKEVDDALQKLEQLAKRQQELAEQQKQGQQQTAEQRWQQEMLRREAEQLRQQLQQATRSQPQQLSRNGPQQGQRLKLVKPDEKVFILQDSTARAGQTGAALVESGRRQMKRPAEGRPQATGLAPLHAFQASASPHSTPPNASQPLFTR